MPALDGLAVIAPALTAGVPLYPAIAVAVNVNDEPAFTVGVAVALLPDESAFALEVTLSEVGRTEKLLTEQP